VSSDFCSELGNTFIFKFKFLPFLACLPPARALLHVLYDPSHTHSRVFATYLSTLCFLISLMFSSFSLFATMVCASLSLYV